MDQDLTKKQIDMIKPKCTNCNVTCKSITEYKNKSALISKGRPHIPVKFKHNNLETQLYVCPNIECRRVYTKEGVLVSNYWVDQA